MNQTRIKFNVLSLKVVIFLALFYPLYGMSQTRIFTPEEMQLNDTYALADMETIRVFVRETLDKPLPQGYIIPSYIRECSDGEMAGNVVGANYPEFYGKHGNEYLETAKAHPAVFVRMINEYKAIRTLFAPTN
jgi:hypothetical protein